MSGIVPHVCFLYLLFPLSMLRVAYLLPYIKQLYLSSGKGIRVGNDNIIKVSINQAEQPEAHVPTEKGNPDKVTGLKIK